MVALPSESRTTAAPEATSSKASSAVLTSAATRGGLPALSSTASQKSRSGPAEAGSAANGSLPALSQPDDECPSQGRARGPDVVPNPTPAGPTGPPISPSRSELCRQALEPT